MQKKNARLPEGKTSALDSANVNTGTGYLVRCLDAVKNPSKRVVPHEISYASIEVTDNTVKSPVRYRNSAPHPTDTTDGSTLLTGLSVTPRAIFEKMRLHGVNPCAYTFLVVGKQPAIRFGDLFSSLAQRSRAVTRHAAFVFAYAFARTFNGRAWVGRPSGLPVSRDAGSPTPLIARSPHLAMGGGLLNLSLEVASMRHIPARPEQTQSPTELANSALRTAALAPTYIDALDVLADAVLALAALVQPLEVRRYA